MSFLAASKQARTSRPTTTRSRDGIFLSYRRDDGGHAADRINAALIRRFGKKRVFYDIDTIPAGANFKLVISERLETCALLIAVIGDHWADSRFREGPRKADRRLDDPEDFVRLEIEAAFQNAIPILPVLVGQTASLPTKEQLPESMQGLVSLNFTTLPAGPDFQEHLQRLVQEVDSIMRLNRSTDGLLERILSRLK